jgi:membrane-associated phospholipid phosphatase
MPMHIIKAQNFETRFLLKHNVHRNTNFDPYFKTLTKSSVYVSLLLPITEYTIGKINNNKKLSHNAYTHLSAFTFTFLLNKALKNIIKRPRPFTKITQLQPYSLLDDYSMPSGHSSGAFTTAGNLAFTYKKWYIVIPAYIWAAQVAYSRPYLGVHYPSDIAIGAFLGTASAYFSKKLSDKIFKPKN